VIEDSDGDTFSSLVDIAAKIVYVLLNALGSSRPGGTLALDAERGSHDAIPS
jgi:hypothetical protein